MIVYRISVEKYASSLSASGFMGRWNLHKEFVIYTSGARSLAALELLTRRNAISVSVKYKCMIISIDDDARLFSEILLSDLPDDWKYNSGLSHVREIGSKWYCDNLSLVLKVPSVLVPKEYNYIINTRHSDFKSSVKLLGTEDHSWDKRLIA